MNTEPSFSNRLARIMEEKQVTRADLARLVWGTTLDSNGYEVARNRQLIGRYLSGETHPENKTKKLLAEALGVNYSKIDPRDNKVRRIGTGVSITATGKKLSQLDLSLELPTEVANHIASLVEPYTE